MSGIVGIINLGGAPVDRKLLERMTGFLKFRGPDAQTVWNGGAVGFGHTLLRTTDESAREQQPYNFDDRIFIVADARIDGREDLIHKLAGKGLDASLELPDVELIVQAYLAWGENCVEHLIGDFAFAIWDARARLLFCARDHFGVKPFFYAQAGESFVFSNTLDCVRMHPAIADELNEQFIGDFLLFDATQDDAATAFAETHRLPPAHSLTASANGISLRRYWSLAEPELIYLKRAGDYVEQFNELFGKAVADRLRTDKVGVQMSGGLDSTAVAAIAKRLLSNRNSGFDLRAYTVIFKRLFADDEGNFAQMVADDLRIPISYQVADDYQPFAHFDRPEIRMSEPCNESAMARAYDQYQQMAENCRVVLTGSDADTVMSEWSKPYFHWLFKRGSFGTLLSGMWWFVRVKRQLPRVGFRYALRQWMNPENWDYTMPGWINRDFARRVNLAERLRLVNERREKHPLRPRAYGVLRSTMFWQVLEPCDPGTTNVPIEWRHPFADLRLIEFLLMVPPVPWLVEKELLKQAMRGVLPKPVIERPKTPLAVDPLQEELRLGNRDWTNKMTHLSEIGAYVAPGRLGVPDENADPYVLWESLRPMSLNHWLATLRPTSQNPELEAINGFSMQYAAS